MHFDYFCHHSLNNLNFKTVCSKCNKINDELVMNKLF